jgi:hypothetical protein
MKNEWWRDRQQTGIPTDVTQLTVAFRKLASEPKNAFL